MKTDNINLQQLLNLIECYFDCSLSDADELQLRRIAATTKLKHPAIDELRACMGIRQTKKHSAFSWRKATAIAASLALIVSLAIGITGWHTADNPTCIAYAQGRCITDEESIMRLLASDMRQFSDGLEQASNQLRDEMSDIAPIIELFESEPTINL